MNITFFIGNGFDRNLGLDTTYSDFVKHYKKTDGRNENLRNFRKHIGENEELWSAAEIEIGKYTNQFEAGQGAAFSECHSDFCEHLSKYLKKQERRVDYNNIADKIESAFLGLPSIAEPFPTQERSIIDQVFACHKSENTAYNFVNFNYTSTLDECVAQIKNKQKHLGTYQNDSIIFKHILGVVQHVHGTVDEQMVFGVNDETQIANLQIFECENGDLYKESLIKKQANDSYQENTDAKVKAILDGSQIVYVYGMSIGETDKLWWKRICAWLSSNPNRHLIVYRHSMPPRGLTGVAYRIEERNARKELTRYADLNEQQCENIEKRIHITNFNVFSAINNTVNYPKYLSTKKLHVEEDVVNSEELKLLTAVGSRI